MELQESLEPQTITSEEYQFVMQLVASAHLNGLSELQYKGLKVRFREVREPTEQRTVAATGNWKTALPRPRQ